MHAEPFYPAAENMKHNITAWTRTSTRKDTNNERETTKLIEKEKIMQNTLNTANSSKEQTNSNE